MAGYSAPVFVAYLDESGHSQETKFFALAACVADWPVWREFNARWQAVLDACSAPYLHMREFAHKRGPYEGWTEGQRRALLAGALSAIDSLEILAIGSVMQVADFRNLEADLQAELVDPTFCCFQDCINGIGLNRYRDFVGWKTDVIYSRQDEFRSRIRTLYDYMSKNTQDGSLLGVLSFQDMRTVPGLQLADLVAYELRHYYHLKATRPELPVRFPFGRIAEHQRGLGAGMFKFVTGWMLQFKTKGMWLEAQNVMWDDPDTWSDLILEMVPAPLDFVARIARLKKGRDIGIVDALRRRELRG
jgi:hypothetical protein